jgi:hypothetical protein
MKKLTSGDRSVTLCQNNTCISATGDLATFVVGALALLALAKFLSR